MGLFSFFIKSPEKYESKGDAFFKANNFGLAKLEYETAIELIAKKKPDDSALKKRVQEKLTNSKETLARQHLSNSEQLIKTDAKDEAENLLRIALSLSEDPELQQRLKELSATLNLETSYDDSTEALQPEDKQKTNDIEDEFEVLCSILPNEMALAYRSYGNIFKAGYLALSNGNFTKAAEMLRQAMEENTSKNTYIPVELATALINLGQTENAIELLTVYIKNNPLSIYAISLLCDVFCELKAFDQAHDLIDKSHADIKTSIEGQLHKGRIYYLENDYQSAEKIYRNVLDTTGWNSDIARELAMTLDAAEKKDEAINIYADLLNKCAGCGQRPNPLDKKAFADLSFELNDFSEKIMNLYLDLANDHEGIRSDCFYKVSTIYSNNGNKKEAERFLKLAEATG